MKYKISYKNGVYTARAFLPLESGDYLVITGKASIADTLRDFGFTDEEVSGIFGSIAKGFKKLGKGIAKVAKKVTKSKALRKVVGIAKDIVKNPITTAALGAVSGGALLAPMAAANAAVRLAEMAGKAGKAGKSARKLLKATMKASKKKKRMRKKIRRHRKAFIRAGVKDPLSIIRAKLRARKKRILRMADKIRKDKARPAYRLSRRAAAASQVKPAADFLVNVHFM